MAEVNPSFENDFDEMELNDLENHRKNHKNNEETQRYSYEEALDLTGEFIYILRECRNKY